MSALKSAELRAFDSSELGTRTSGGGGGAHGGAGGRVTPPPAVADDATSTNCSS